MIKKIGVSFAIALVMGVLILPAWAAIPQIINIQGVVKAQGNSIVPTSDTVNVEFWGNPVKGTTPIKTYNAGVVSIDEGGYFNIPLQVDTSITPFDIPYYIVINFSTIGKFPATGRQPLLAVPYALGNVAKTGDTMTGALTVKTDVVNATAFNGLNSATTGAGIGVLGQSDADGYGVVGRANSANAKGVFAQSTSGYGLYSDAPKNYFSGNVGIGKNDPTAPLEISKYQAYINLLTNSSANGSVIQLINKAATKTYLGALNFGDETNQAKGQIGYLPNNSLTFRTNGDNAPKMVIDSTGKVGIGTTSPGVKLDVEAPASNGNAANFTGHAPDATWAALMINQDNGGFGIYDQAAKHYFAGKVGIGTPEPTVKLDVDGGTKPAISAHTMADVALYATNTSSLPSIYCKNNGIGSAIFSAGPFELVQQSSNLLISGGEYSPPYLEGPKKVLRIQAQDILKNGLITLNGKGGWVSINSEMMSSNPDVKLYVHGAMQAWGTVYPSDLRLKTNIHPINNAIDKIKKINGVYYEWNDKYKSMNKKESWGREIGLIGQEVQNVFPELVAVGSDKEKTLSLNYDRVCAVLIQAVKEQQAQIEKQQKEIDELKAKIK